MSEQRLATLAVVGEVVRLGQERLGRVGHTLIQKLVYLLQAGFGVRLGYAFKMYMHGPYSPDLWGDLTQLRDYGAIDIDADPTGYGYRITATPALSKVQGGQEQVLEEVRVSVERLLHLLAPAHVRRLEILATSHFAAANLKRRGRTADPDTVADTVRALKPHLNLDEIKEGYAELARAGLVS